MTDQEYIALIAISKIPKVGPILGKNLISYCGGILSVFEQKPKQLCKIPGIGENIAKNIVHADFNEAEREYAWLRKNDVTPISFLEDAYPNRFIALDGCPILLYYKGNASLNHTRTVGIVGTRQPSNYGHTQCENILETISKYNVLIVSGLAYGIDGIAHKKSIELSIPTIGILGHGLDRIYPSSHTSLSQKMIGNGGLLTEFASGTLPDKENFPMRNRLIAALCDAIIIVESKRQGGSIITAEFANDFNKDVFAVPGNVNVPLSEGCNKLIKQNKAHLLESGDDVAYIMRWDDMDSGKTIQRQLFIELSDIETKICEALNDKKELTIDNITYIIGKTPSETSSILLEMEFKGILRNLPGKKFTLN
ncbi:MAG: DNA-processing protein DprA [Saprospiraceae bacterium]